MVHPRSTGILRRLPGRIIACLLLGAILQSVVAVAFSLRGTFATPTRTWVLVVNEAGRDVGFMIRRYPSIGRDVLLGNIMVHASGGPGSSLFALPDWTHCRWLTPDLAGHPIPIRAEELSPGTPPAWSRFLAAPDNPAYDYYAPTQTGVCIEVASGWPMRSASYFAAEPNGPGPYNVREGIVLANITPTLNTTPRVIPLRIHWPGAIVNTLVYAAALLVPFTFVPMLRRHLRHRAGRCAQCNYDLRATTTGTCPECGVKA